MKILQLTVHFHPNLGGVETHIIDLIYALAKRHWDVFVLTYRPLVIKAKWKTFENLNNITIIRLPWIPGLFYWLIKNPVLEFLYLFPGLFIVTPIVILLKDPDVIHGHGLVAGFVASFWGKLFGKKIVISTHSIYHFPEKGLYKIFAKWIFAQANWCLGLSKQAVEEIKSLGIDDRKVDTFIYWVDLNKFRVQSSKFRILKKLGWDDKFIVLFVGRLVEEKGIGVLLKAAPEWSNNIHLIIIGSGPLEDYVKRQSDKEKNIKFLGRVDQDELPLYYNAADLLIVPSAHEEGFGRVILESLACGTPVIGAKRGAIPEAMDDTVGKLIDITPKNIKNIVEYFYNHKDKLKKLASNCRSFAERRYSESNVEKIIKAYTK